LFIKSQLRCESQFFMHNKCNSGRTCRTHLGLIQSFFVFNPECLPAYVYGSANKQKTVSFSHVPHAVYIFA